MSEKSNIDNRLLKGIKNGSDLAFEEAYNRYWKQLFNFGMKKLDQRETVEGIVQEVFIDLWVRRSKLEINQTLSTYLHSSVNYKIINQYKSQSVRRKYLDTLKSQYAHLGFSIEEMIHFNDLKLRISSITEEFPSQRKKAYDLRFNKGLSYKEIAETMKISASTVEKHLIRAIKDLRISLKELTLTGSLLLSQDFLFCII